MIVFYDEAYHSTAHAWDTTRKSKDIAEYLRMYHADEIELVPPTPLGVNTLSLCHSKEYIDAVMTGHPSNLATSSGFEWCPNMFKAVCSSNGGVLQAASVALTEGVAGTLSSGLHHAKRERGAGFCTFNGIAIAAQYARRVWGKRVLIVDFDAHYGDGTAELIEGEELITQVDVSTHEFLRSQHSGLRYLTTCISRLVDADVAQYDLVLYNAGMDPHEHCRLGGLEGVNSGVLAERDRFVFNHCRSRCVPVAFCLAGGYANNVLTPTRLAALHATTCVIAHDSKIEQGNLIMTYGDFSDDE